MIYLLFILIGLIFAGLFMDIISGVILLIAIGLFMYTYYNKYSLRKILICFLLFAAGVLYYNLSDYINIEKYGNVELKNEQLSAVVLSEPEYINGTVKFIGKLDKFNKKAVITLRDTPYISYYDTIDFKGYVYSITSNRENSYSKGIYYKVTSSDKDIKIKSGKGIYKSLNTFRNKVLYILDNNFSFETSMLLKGVMVGDDSLRTEEFNSALNKLSLSHIVSVSGMHFSIITMYILLILRRIKIGRKMSSVIIIPINFLIALFIGFTPSVIRVLIMTTILSLADLFNRDRVMDIYLLVLTAVIMLLYNVYYIHNIAFTLSFASLGGILLYQDIIFSKIKKLPGKIRELISVTVSANIFTLPLVIYYFKGIPLLSIFANIIVVSFVPLFMMYGIVVVIISLVIMKLGYYVGYPLDLLTSMCVKFICFIGDLSFGYVATLSIEEYFVLLYYSGIYVCSLKIKGIYKKILTIIIGLYFTVNLFYPLDRIFVPYGNMYVMCGKNSGKGIVTYKDKTIFVNASGINGSFNQELIRDECNNYFDIYIPFNSEGIRYIDTFKFKVGKVYVPHYFVDDFDFNVILNKYCDEIIEVYDKSEISFYDFNLTLKAQDEYNISEVDIQHKDNKIVFTGGDIDEINYGEKYIVPYYSIEKYNGNSFLLNCMEDELERIKI